MSTTAERIGHRIIALRKKLGLNRADLSRATTFRENDIYRWETGQNVPNLQALMALSAALGVSVEELAGKDNG